VQRNLQDLGALLLQTEFDRLAVAAKNISQVADLTDVDIAEAHLSKKLASEAMAQVAPIHAVLDFWRALRWLVPGWPVDKVSKLAKILKAPKDAANPLLDGLVKLLDPSHNLVTVLSEGVLDGKDAATQAANDLIQRARALAARETFFHWWTSFPTVFDSQGQGGFDAIIGNPPWDRIKLQEVEWFAERDTAIAAQSRAADRKRMVTELQKNKAPLYDSYLEATERAEAAARVLGNGKLGSGDYPLLGGGDVNLYSLFVERCQTLAAANGIVALLTPSGIAADKGAAEFFRSISTTKRLGAMFDFENRKGFFPDVDSRFKFCTLVFGGTERQFAQTRCAFYLHQLAELDDAKRILTLTAEDFSRVNPNTGAAPIFRSQRDADITLKLYAQHPVLVKHGELKQSTGQQPDVKVWPVKYATMFHMTNDSHLFLKAAELKQQGFKPTALNRWVNAAGAEAVPLYEGKMVQMYDHRAADVVVNTDNLHRAAQQESIESIQKVNPGRYPSPQYWVKTTDVPGIDAMHYCLAFKDVTAPTNMRTMIAAMVPAAGYGNTLPVLLPSNTAETTNGIKGAGVRSSGTDLALLLANFGSFAFDFVARQKVQGQHLNWFVVEQLPVIAPDRFEQSIGGIKIADFIRQHVLALTYTAHDMAPFARDMGYVHTSGPHKGEVKPPFEWNDEDRRARLAALDALFFYLYGLSTDDAAYILDTFPIVRDQDTKAFGRYRTKDDVLEKLAMLASGKMPV
jgi:Eco57I restriction-modification methylase